MWILLLINSADTSQSGYLHFFQLCGFLQLAFVAIASISLLGILRGSMAHVADLQTKFEEGTLNEKESLLIKKEQAQEEKSGETYEE